MIKVSWLLFRKKKKPSCFLGLIPSACFGESCHLETVELQGLPLGLSVVVSPRCAAELQHTILSLLKGRKGENTVKKAQGLR